MSEHVINEEGQRLIILPYQEGILIAVLGDGAYFWTPCEDENLPSSLTLFEEGGFSLHVAQEIEEFLRTKAQNYTKKITG